MSGRWPSREADVKEKQVYQFAANLKSDRAFFFYRGEVALYALLNAIGVKQGDEVISQSFTCPAVPSPIVRLKATPVYVDIDPLTFNIDPAKIEAKITPKTKALIVQHTFGIPAEIDPILDIARKHKLRVIEDACHALGARYRGREVGSFGDAAFYSFGWHKPISLGVGGAAVVNNPALDLRMEKVYECFVTPSLKELFRLHLQYLAYSWIVTPSRFWFFKEVYRRLSILGIIVGTSRRKRTRSGATNTAQSKRVAGTKIIPHQERRLFRKLDRWKDMAAHQKWIVSQYKELLSKAGYTPFELDSHLEPIYYKYPLLSNHKRAIFEQAKQMRIEMSDMFGSPLYPPDRRANWKTLGYEEGTCPVAEKISDTIVALPVHAKIRANDIERTCALLASFSQKC